VTSTWVVTLRINGASTALLATCASAATCQDVTNTVAVAAGDRMALEFNRTAGANTIDERVVTFQCN
jgi:uncharacterized lipoprotein YajG